MTWISIALLGVSTFSSCFQICARRTRGSAAVHKQLREVRFEVEQVVSDFQHESQSQQPECVRCEWVMHH